MEELIKTLSEGQQHLQQALQLQSQQAQAGRLAFQQALQLQQAQLLEVTNVRNHPQVPTSILQKYTAGEDPAHFFVNCERVARNAQWPTKRWCHYIAPLMTGEMQCAYQAANPTGDTNYGDMKKVVLERLGHDEETYRIKFREVKLTGEETPRQLFYRVKELAEKWLQSTTSSPNEITEKIVLEQFVEALPGPVQRWVKQHHRPSLAEAVDITSAYQKAGQGKMLSYVNHPKTHVTMNKPMIQTRWPNSMLRKPESENICSRPSSEGPVNYRQTTPSVQGPQCFYCGDWGHLARFCPKKVQLNRWMWECLNL
ncbi:zinc finger protein 213-like [Ambystoma mexicanum]|uniref:zinc finger protein 213-like n=1 Tax=Ambystoma mexicanum TaxID=8296 RepID=UPI0037E99968